MSFINLIRTEGNETPSELGMNRDMHLQGRMKRTREPGRHMSRGRMIWGFEDLDHRGSSWW